jgi:putative transposase
LEARRLRSLEDENARLKKLLAELMQNEAALRDFLGKNGRFRLTCSGAFIQP